MFFRNFLHVHNFLKITTITRNIKNKTHQIEMNEKSDILYIVYTTSGVSLPLVSLDVSQKTLLKFIHMEKIPFTTFIFFVNGLLANCNKNKEYDSLLPKGIPFHTSI